MQALDALLNPTGHTIPIQAGKSARTIGFALPDRGENQSFTEVYMQLLAGLPQAQMGGQERFVNRPIRLAAQLDQKVPAAQEKSDLSASEVNLAEILLSGSLPLFGQPDITVAQPTAAAAMSDLTAAPQLKSGRAQAIAATTQTPVRTAINLAANELADHKPTASASFMTVQSVWEGSARPSGQASQIRAAAPIPLDAKASTYNPINQPFARLVGPTDLSRVAAPTAPAAVHPNAASAINSGQILSKPEKASLPGKSSPSSMRAAEQLVRQPAETIIAVSGPVKAEFAELGRISPQETINKATPPSWQPAAAQPASMENGIKPVNQDSAPAGHDKLQIAAGKKADPAMETREPDNTLNQSPALYDRQVNPLQPGVDKPVMAKTQIDMITQQLANQINSGTSKLEIDLQPEALGKIKLMFQMEDGSLTVRIIAHTGEAHHLLDASLQNMKENLNQQGYKIDEMSLDLANQERQGEQSGSEHPQTGRPAQGLVETPKIHENTTMGEPPSTQYNRLNILA